MANSPFAARLFLPSSYAAHGGEQFLAAGPRASHDIWQAAQKAGLSARTVQRAKLGLDIRCRRVYAGGRPVSYWLLQGQELPSGPSGFPELDRLIAELERQYPPRTPLDEDDLDGGIE